jgi:hypothetical protein
MAIDILSNFKVNNWYKLAIYLGAVLIILSFVFVNNSDVTKYTNFAVESLILGSLAWVAEDTIRAYGYWVEGKAPDYSKQDAVKDSAIALYAVEWIGLLIWIGMILSSF